MIDDALLLSTKTFGLAALLWSHVGLLTHDRATIHNLFMCSICVGGTAFASVSSVIVCNLHVLLKDVDQHLVDSKVLVESSLPRGEFLRLVHLPQWSEVDSAAMKLSDDPDQPTLSTTCVSV